MSSLFLFYLLGCKVSCLKLSLTQIIKRVSQQDPDEFERNIIFMFSEFIEILQILCSKNKNMKYS